MSDPRACWRCGDATEVHAVSQEADTILGATCSACGALQPPRPGLDHFARMGVARRYALDPETLRARNRQFQRRLHPDRHAHRDERERRFAMEHATAINDALRVLADPRARADYLLHLAGREVGAEGAERVLLSPVFLMEIMELREAIGELTGPDAHVERTRLARTAAGRIEETLSAVGARLDDALARDEAGETGAWPPDAATLDTLVERLAELRYLERVTHELEELGA